MNKIHCFLIIMIFLIFLINSCEKNPTELNEAKPEIAKISFMEEDTSGLLGETYVSFELNSRHIINLNTSFQKDISFESQQIFFTILDFQNVSSYKIFVGFISESETWGDWESREGKVSLYCIGQNSHSMYSVNVGPNPCVFNGKVFCFILENSTNQNPDEIKIQMRLNESFTDTLIIDPKINILSTDNFLNIRRDKLPTVLPVNSAVRIEDMASDSYLFGCIWINSEDDYFKVKKPSNATYNLIYLYNIHEEYNAYYFAYPKQY
jgi:hypothetical protein